MAITKIDANSFDLTDDYAFTGTISGAGGLVKLQTQTVGSDVASVSFSSTYLTSTYTTYFVTGFIIPTATSSVDLYMYPSIDNGSNYNLDCAGNIEGRYENTANSNEGEHTSGGVNTTFWYLGQDAMYGSASDISGGVMFSGYLWNSPDQTVEDSSHFTATYNRSYAEGGTNYHTMPGYGGGSCFTAGAAVNNFKIQWESGNVKAGSKVTLYGVSQ